MTSPHGSVDYSRGIPRLITGKEAFVTAEKPAHHRIDYPAFTEREDYRGHRRRQRSFVFPVLAAALVWYILYVLAASYLPAFMSTPVWGYINVGLIVGLSQFVVTFVITGIYVRYSNRKLDPSAAELRSVLEAKHEKGEA
jgi:uncharacterized membrane protein (DUF485 family)